MAFKKKSETAIYTPFELGKAPKDVMKAYADVMDAFAEASEAYKAATAKLDANQAVLRKFISGEGYKPASGNDFRVGKGFGGLQIVEDREEIINKPVGSKTSAKRVFGK